MRTGLAIFICMWCSFLTMAQKLPSGYLGKVKYAFVGVEANISAHNQRPSSEDETGMDGFFPSIDVKAAYGRVISEKLSLEVTYRNLRSSMSFSNGEYLYLYNGSFFNNGKYHEITSTKGSPSMTGHELGVNARFYVPSRGAICPLGLYLGTGLSLGLVRVDYKKMIFNSYFDKKEYIETRLQKGFGVRTAFTLGLTRAIGNRFLIDFGSGLSIGRITKSNLEFGDSEMNELLNQALQKRYTFYAPMYLQFQVGYTL